MILTCLVAAALAPGPAPSPSASWTAKVVSARLLPEIVRYEAGSVRALAAPDGERWLALHVRISAPDGPSVPLNSRGLAVTAGTGRSRPPVGITGWDPQAPGPTFLVLADAAELARISFPPIRSDAYSGSGWGYASTEGERISVSYSRVQGGRWQSGFSVDKSGAISINQGPLDAVFLFAVPTGATRFTLKLDDRPLATVTASASAAIPGQALEAGCRRGRGQDCVALSAAYEGGSGVPIDIARAVELLARGCDAGSAQACLYLGGHLATGTGVPKDPARALALIEKSCTQGYDEGCATLGLRYLNGEGVAKDPARAVATLTGQCDAGGPLACNALGFIFGRVEPGVARDPARAVELYRRSCDAGHTEACLNLSKLHAPGGADADLPGAAEAHRKACDLNDTWSCTTLGYRYFHGLGVPRDHRLARAVLVAPCETQQDGYACGWLGEIWWLGSPGIARTPETAAGYYRKACDLGILPSCTNLGLMHLRGIAMPRDEGKGRALIQQACSGGYAGACRELESIR